jgi:glucose-6-phosphate isomerase
VRLAEESGLRERIEQVFRGERINVTEDRAVLHVALRHAEGTIARRGRARRRPASPRRARPHGDFADRVRSGAWTGHTGQRIATS